MEICFVLIILNSYTGPRVVKKGSSYSQLPACLMSESTKGLLHSENSDSLAVTHDQNNTPPSPPLEVEMHEPVFDFPALSPASAEVETNEPACTSNAVDISRTSQKSSVEEPKLVRPAFTQHASDKFVELLGVWEKDALEKHQSKYWFLIYIA